MLGKGTLVTPRIHFPHINNRYTLLNTPEPTEDGRYFKCSFFCESCHVFFFSFLLSLIFLSKDPTSIGTEKTSTRLIWDQDNRAPYSVSGTQLGIACYSFSQDLITYSSAQRMRFSYIDYYQFGTSLSNAMAALHVPAFKRYKHYVFGLLIDQLYVLPSDWFRGIILPVQESLLSTL